MKNVITLFFACLFALLPLFATTGCHSTKKAVDKFESFSYADYDSVDSAKSSKLMFNSQISEADMLSKWKSFVSERMSRLDREIVVESITTHTDSAGAAIRQEQRTFLRASDVQNERESSDEYTMLVHAMDSLSAEVDSLREELHAVSKSNAQQASSESSRKESRPAGFSMFYVGAALLALSLLLMLDDWMKERKKGKAD